jgi:hypothetical protein
VPTCNRHFLLVTKKEFNFRHRHVREKSPKLLSQDSERYFAFSSGVEKAKCRLYLTAAHKDSACSLLRKSKTNMSW